MECRVTISRVANGYQVRLTDPKIRESNKKSKGEWQDPEVVYVFRDIKKAMEFLEKNVDKALPAKTYDTSFNEAVAEYADE